MYVRSCQVCAQSSPWLPTSLRVKPQVFTTIYQVLHCLLFTIALTSSPITLLLVTPVLLALLLLSHAKHTPGTLPSQGLGVCRPLPSVLPLGCFHGLILSLPSSVCSCTTGGFSNSPRITPPQLSASIHLSVSSRQLHWPICLLSPTARMKAPQVCCAHCCNPSTQNRAIIDAQSRFVE